MTEEDEVLAMLGLVGDEDEGAPVLQPWAFNEPTNGVGRERMTS